MRAYLGIFAAVAILAGGWIYTSRSGYKGNAKVPKFKLAFEFKEISESLGMIHKHENIEGEAGPTAHLQQFVASNSAMVSVVDFDNDGFPDIFVNTSKPGATNKLYKNNGDGTFTDVAARAKLAIFNKRFTSSGAMFFDMDNDGDKDAVILGASSNPRIFTNNGKGEFHETSAITIPKGLDSNLYVSKVGNVIDYDNDGYLDMILADKWGDGMPNSLVDATNGGRIFVFHNERGRHFKMVSNSLGFRHVGFTRSIGIWDIRGTGRPDVWFANDFSPDRLYLNEGGGKFKEISESILTDNFSRNGMNSDFADLDNDGMPVVFVSHIFQPYHRLSGNTLWKWKGGNTFEEQSRYRGVNRCGWAWGGKFIDLDNNGLLDLVVGNGFISQNPSKDYWYFMSVLSASSRAVTRQPRSWPPIKDHSLAGYQPACVYYNDGKWFREITDMTGMAGDISDERGLAAIDYKNDGSQSLAIANQNQPFKLYAVTQKNNNDWVGFKLTGTKSNRDAYGSTVKIVLADGRRMSRQLQPFNAYGSQSDDRPHFGLGANAKLKSVEIIWPSGTKQIFTGDRFKLRTYNAVTEGEP